MTASGGVLSLPMHPVNGAAAVEMEVAASSSKTVSV